jgi:hypothetical protein
MRLKTFNRYHHSEYYLSCGTIAVSLITGKTPEEVKLNLNNLRRKNNWTEAKIYKEWDFMYWYEALELIKTFTRRTKTVYPRYNPPLNKLRLSKKQTYLVCTTNHLQVVKGDEIFDAYENGSLYPRTMKNHPWARRKVWCYQRLTSGKK